MVAAKGCLSEEPEKSPKLPPQKEENGWMSVAFILAKVSGIGWVFAGSIILGALTGYYLDRFLGTSPWVFLAGLVIGTISAFVVILRLIKIFWNNSQGS